MTEGSPPHTRGKVRNRALDRDRPRITPACAGKSGRQPGWPCSAGDHPRIRGEKIWLSAPPMPSIGSPPHTRGKVLHPPVTNVARGITPAYAGKSWPPDCDTAHIQDHPRIRGEKLYRWIGMHAMVGSPPHTRGKVAGRPASHVLPGITPAYAGKSPA